jgi:hypothetical protein
MPTNSQLFNKLPKWANREAEGSIRLDTATYVGIVKNNLDPARAGRLQVWIPEIGGNEDDPVNWRTLGYASPFFGQTYYPEANKENSFKQAKHTYGFWAVPPDLGNQVLCTFVNGDPDRGFWFACVYNSAVSHFMVPGIAAGNIVDNTNTDTALADTVNKDASALPVTEFNENNPDSVNANFINNPKPIHEEQYKRLIQQGLDKDRVRGAVTSSSQRETPSTVFGISTPGRIARAPAEYDAFIAAIDEGTISDSEYNAFNSGPRRGGHQFVMDDGDIYGTDNLVRLRSAAGHQILMNDQNRVMYIANSEGSVWMEFSENGHMHVYSAGGLNIRTEGDLNLHSDKSVNITAKDKVNMTGSTSINLETNEYISRTTGKTTIYGAGVNIGSGGDLNLYADSKGNFQAGGALACVGDQILLNSGGGAVVPEPRPIPTFVHSDTTREAEGKPWSSVNNAADSLSSVLPSHEPWKRQTGVNRENNTAAGDLTGTSNGPTDISFGAAPNKIIPSTICVPKGAIRTDITGKPILDNKGNPVRASVAEADPGPKYAATKAMTRPMPREWLGRPDVPNPKSGIGPLTKYQVKCLMAQLGYAESDWKYDARLDTDGNYLGRYQLYGGPLTDLGYIKPEYYQKYGNAAVRNPDSWNAVDNVKSDADFIVNKAAQENAMNDLLKLNYETLAQKVDNQWGINPDDDLCTVAGMLAVAYLLGPVGARNWRFNNTGKDIRGYTGDIYFNRGRYAIDSLANAGAASAGGGSPSPTVRVDASGLTDAAKEAAAQNLNPDDYIQFTNQGTRTGTKERFNMMQAPFKAMILGAAKEYKAKYGQKLLCNSAFRTQEDQIKIYNAWVEGGGNKDTNPKVNTKEYGWLYIPVAKVGNHGQGIAMDLPKDQIQQMDQMGLLVKYGIQWGIVFRDPPHVQWSARR